MSSWRQWKIGSDVSSSAKMQPMAQMSKKNLKNNIGLFLKTLNRPLFLSFITPYTGVCLKLAIIISLLLHCYERTFASKMLFEISLSNGYSPQIRENGKLLVRMCRMRVTFFQKWPLANVGESGESVTAFWRIFKLGRFMYKKTYF